MLWNIIFLSCLTIAALLFAMFVFFRLRVRGTDGIRKFYSDAQLRSIREEAAERERQIILAKMRDSLESGQGTTLMLRQVFSDQMVVVSEGKYYFYPVKEDVEKNIIPSGMLICEDGKTVEYKGSYPSMTLSHGALISDDNGRIDWDRLSQSDVSELTIRAGKLRSGGFDPDRQFERNYEEAGKRNIPVMLCLEVDKPCSESVLSRAVDEMMSLISRVESSGEESAEPSGCGGVVAPEISLVHTQVVVVAEAVVHTDELALAVGAHCVEVVLHIVAASGVVAQGVGVDVVERGGS